MKVFIRSSNNNRMFRQPEKGTPIKGVESLESFVDSQCKQYIIKESNTAIKSRGMVFDKDVTLEFSNKGRKCLFLMHRIEVKNKGYQWVLERGGKNPSVSFSDNIKELIVL